jgi:peptidoglycan/LPS O-acetylase OafA/YrhL
MNSAKKKRNYTIDALKAVTAWFVVLNHAYFPGEFGRYVAFISHFASPIFFITAGYFAVHTPSSKTIKSIKKMLRYIAFAYVLNLIRVFVIKVDCDFGAFCTYFSEKIFTVKHMLSFLLINETIVSGVTWFLFTMLYCYLLRLLLKRKTLIKLCYFLTAFSFIIVIASSVFNFYVPINNVWIRGMPFFAIGGYIRLYLERESHPMSRMKAILIALFGFIILNIAYFTDTALWHVGTLFMSPALYYIACRSDIKKNILCPLGFKYSFMVYILHPIIIHIYDYCRQSPGLIELWLRPFFIIILTILSALLYYLIKDSIVWGIKQLRLRLSSN